ncbi:MAG TPA: hypothetical protein VNW04_21035, partial [Puia sp.]|nr:hypothetical protein [Puia sp.]
MYDRKFEKGVRQKMEGLEFAPPESVWANIEKAVAGRRRRGGFFFWRFALPGLLLLGAVSVVYLTDSPARIAPTASKAVGPVGPASNPHPLTPAAQTRSASTAASAQVQSMSKFVPSVKQPSGTQKPIGADKGVAADNGVATDNSASAEKGAAFDPKSPKILVATARSATTITFPSTTKTPSTTVTPSTSTPASA